MTTIYVTLSIIGIIYLFRWKLAALFIDWIEKDNEHKRKYKAN